MRVFMAEDFGQEVMPFGLQLLVEADDARLASAQGSSETRTESDLTI